MDRLRSVSFLMNLFLLYPGVVSSGDSSSCTPAIDMTGHQRFVKPPGQSLTLKCPVRICYLGLPNIIWCKITGELCEPVRTGDGINSNMVKRGNHSAVYLLRFDSVQMSDTGYYQCRAIFKEQQIMGRTVEIIISVQPSTFLKLNRDGSPECGAVGGNPPAEISWIPHSDNVTTRILEEPDQTRTVISTFSAKRVNETSVTCVISHPTFPNPWTGDITLRGMPYIAVQPSTFLILNRDGSPECRAVGGNPPAEIFWIPHSDDITTKILEESDQTRTVISTFSTKGMNETSVTCVISHPSFPNPWTGDITLRGTPYIAGYKLRLDNILRIIVTVIFTVLIVGRLLYLKIKSQKQNIPGEQMNEP